MTAQSEAVAPAQSDTGSAEAAFPSLDALRDAHSALRRSLSRASDTEGVGTRDQQIRSFLTRACGAGVFLADAKERRVAQSLLDYWSAELASSLTDKSPGPVPSLLAEFDPARAPRQSDQPDAAPPVDPKSDQRALIRLSALARQWRDSGKQAGYLLTGASLEEAAQHKDQDSNLAELVEASERVAERRRTTIMVASLMALTAVVSIAVTAAGIIYFVSAAGNLINAAVASGLTNALFSNPATLFRWLDRFQPLLPPYDLSGPPKYADLNLPKLRLYAPNFSNVAFSNVKFPGATMPAASFSASSFSFDGSPGNDFSSAELRQAQFRGARISNTSFANADLYRASFDRALLCDIDFTGANLRYASFWGVTLGGTTKDNLKQTAWWLALGWPWDRILEVGQESANSKKEDESLRNRLKGSKGFKDDIQRPIDDIRGSSASTPELAVALNNFAWTDAVWGIDVATGDAEANVAIDANSCGSNSLPANAIQASLRAICIANRLNRNGELKVFLSNLRDTQAYLYMQNGDAAKALETYALIANDDPTSLQDPETSFRYAVALYAGGKDSDKAAAVERFRTAVGLGRYQPTHELHTLRDHIFPVKEFVEALKASTNKLWPAVENQMACPTPHRGPATK